MKHLPIELQNIIKEFVIFTPKTNEELQVAVDLWRLNKKEALRNYGHISNWNTLLITDISYLFYCKTDSDLTENELNHMKIDDFEKLTNYHKTLRIFNEYILYWNVSNVTDMRYMFHGCENFNAPLNYKQLRNTWIQSQRVDFNIEMFGDDEPVMIPENYFSVTLEDLIDLNITKENYHEIINLANYIMVDNVDPIVDKIVEVAGNVDVVYEFEDFYRLSERLKPLTREQLKEQIKEFNETNLEMFYKYGHSSFWDVSNVTDVAEIFKYSAFKGDISKWNVSNVTTMEDMFERSKYFNGDISKWNVSNVTNMRNMFANSQFNGDISQWKVSNVTDMWYIFWGSQFNGDISKWDVSNVTNMRSMFYNSQFNGDISQWNVSKVRNMNSMFCYSKFNGDISKWNVSNVTNMESMFYTSSFNGDISQWNVSNVTVMCWMFRWTKFNGDISQWDVSNVTNMNGMFFNSQFNEDISQWNVSSVINMKCMFYESPFNGNISQWNVSNVTDASWFNNFYSSWTNVENCWEDISVYNLYNNE